MKTFFKNNWKKIVIVGGILLVIVAVVLLIVHLVATEKTNSFTELDGIAIAVYDSEDEAKANPVTVDNTVHTLQVRTKESVKVTGSFFNGVVPDFLRLTISDNGENSYSINCDKIFMNSQQMVVKITVGDEADFIEKRMLGDTASENHYFVLNIVGGSINFPDFELTEETVAPETVSQTEESENVAESTIITNNNTENSDTENSDTENSDTENSDTENSDTENSDTENSDTENSDTENSDTENSSDSDADTETNSISETETNSSSEITSGEAESTVLQPSTTNLVPTGQVWINEVKYDTYGSEKEAQEAIQNEKSNFTLPTFMVTDGLTIRVVPNEKTARMTIQPSMIDEKGIDEKGILVYPENWSGTLNVEEFAGHQLTLMFHAESAWGLSNGYQYVSFWIPEL